MKISILIQGSPYTTSACETALDFAITAIRAGHEIYRVFFYKDAVLIANRFLEISSDERNVQKEWQAYSEGENKLLSLCIASGQRRGIVGDGANQSIALGFEVSGLGQFVEATLESDRVVSF